MTAVEALLAGAIDYAGLFPPAALDLESTVRNYESYRGGGDVWALGRLILPPNAFAAFAERWPDAMREWPISLLLSGDFAAEVSEAVVSGVSLDVVECRLARSEQIAELRHLLPNAEVFVETPMGEGMEEWIEAIAAAGVCAKVRTGGVTAGAIPATLVVAKLLVACAKSGVRLKATAGLHHPIRGERALTYEANSERAAMHGFVNFFMAAALAFESAAEDEIEAVLSDEVPESFMADENRLRWREREFTVAAIKPMRERFAMSFGSCSFTEPLEDLRAIGWVG